MSKHKSLRLDSSLLERLEVIAKENRMEFSAAVRMALKRGLSVLEAEAGPDVQADPPRRRVFSRGVG